MTPLWASPPFRDPLLDRKSPKIAHFPPERPKTAFQLRIGFCTTGIHTSATEHSFVTPLWAPCTTGIHTSATEHSLVTPLWGRVQRA